MDRRPQLSFLTKVKAGIQFIALMATLPVLSQTEPLPDLQHATRHCDELLARVSDSPQYPYQLLLRNLRRATTQCVGNCVHHQATSAAEYLGASLSGMHLLLNRAYLSANSMREAAYQVIDTKLNPELIGIGEYEDQEFNHGMNEWSLIEKYGVLPEKMGPKDYKLFEIANRLRSLMRSYRKKLSQTESVRERVHVNSFFRFRIDQVLTEYGCDPNQKIMFNGNRISPIQLADTLLLRGIKWNSSANETSDSLFTEIEKSISLGLPVTADISVRHSTKALGLSDAYKWNGIQKNPGKRRFRWRILTSSPYTQSDADSSHALLVVGTSIDTNGNKFLILQNSWGATVYGREGLIPVPLEAFRTHSSYVLIPEVNQPTLPEGRPIRSPSALTPRPASAQRKNAMPGLPAPQAWRLATQTFSAVLELAAMDTLASSGAYSVKTGQELPAIDRLARSRGYSVFLTGVSALRLLNFIERKTLELGSSKTYADWLKDKQILKWNDISPDDDEMEIALLSSQPGFRYSFDQSEMERSIVELVRDIKFTRRLKVRTQSDFHLYASKPHYFNALDRILISSGRPIDSLLIGYYLSVYGQIVNLQNWAFGLFSLGAIDSDSNATVAHTLEQDAEAISLILLQHEAFERGKLTIRTQEFIEHCIKRFQQEAPGQFDFLIARANEALHGKNNRSFR